MLRKSLGFRQSRSIIQRVADDRAAYEERNARKNKSEANYYELKSSGKVEKSEERG